MSTWLLAIVGATIIGVLIELLLTESAMSKFVRTVYAFFILFIIVQPLPGFFKSFSANMANAELPVNSALSRELEQARVEALVERARQSLENQGFNNCIVTYFDGVVYVNAHNSTNKDTGRIISIVMAAMNVPESAVEVFI